jgi:hypothetical protein
VSARKGTAALAIAAAVLIAVGPSPSAARAAETCPNAILRAEDRSLSLPDCRAYELVSPAEKNGGAMAAPGTLWGGGVLQAAATGETATFSSSASFGEGALGAPPASQYLSTRTTAGWRTANITPPTLSGAYGSEPDGVPYQIFSTDLARALMLDGRRCAEGEGCPRSYSLLEPPGEVSATSAAEPDLRFEGASPDLRHVVLAEESGLYEWSGAAITTISAAPGAALAAQGAGAVSEDGSRVYFTAGGDLYLREGASTKQLDAAAGGGGAFQAASAGGAYAFFAKAGHLYRYSAVAATATDLTASGGVKGVLGASADGSYVYYQDAAGLKRWHEGSTATLAAGAEAAQQSDWSPTTATARVSADGAELAFLSAESLTGYDNVDQRSGEPDSEVYLWSAAAGLRCLSCNPTEERPAGPSSIPGAIADGTGEGAADSYRPRALSADGHRLFFDSADQIVPGDVSVAPDVYEWEAPGEGRCAQGGAGFHASAAGCLFLVSSGQSVEASIFADASADGRDALFLTVASLLGRDPGSVDLYDARAEGGFPEPTPPTPCEGDACQAVPSPPEDPSPGTLVSGLANPPVHFAKPDGQCPKGKRAVKRHGKEACVAKRNRKRGKRHHRRGRR